MLQACSGKGRVAEEKNMERENTRQGIQVKNLHKSFQTGSERTGFYTGTGGVLRSDGTLRMWEKYIDEYFMWLRESR